MFTSMLQSLQLEKRSYISLLARGKTWAYNREKEAKGWYHQSRWLPLEGDIDVESINVNLAPVRMADN